MFRHARWIVGLLLLAAAPIRAEEAPTRPAFSERNVRDLLIDFDMRFIADVYKAKGHRDPKWDADVIAFLPDQIRGGFADIMEPFYVPAGTVPLARRAATAKRIVDAGCDDAIVLYEAGLALSRSGDKANAAVAFARGEAAAEASPYLPVLQLALHKSYVLSHSASGGKASPEDLARAKALLRAVLTDRTALPQFRRACWNTASDYTIEDREPELLQIGEMIEGTPNADPWLYGTLMGRVEIKRAWAARGGGYANTVTQDGWKQFSAHLAAARQHFQDAVEADDADPQPFAYMITVAMGESSGTEGDWFRNALDRQCDYKAAYLNHLTARLPRWGGTHGQMLQIGIDAVATGRFDTRVPALLLDAIDAVEFDMRPAKLDGRQLEDIYPQVVRCLDGYIEHSDSAITRAWARGVRAAWAARLGKWEEVHAQLAAIQAGGDKLDERTFKKFGLDVDEVRRHAAGATK